MKEELERDRTFSSCFSCHVIVLLLLQCMGFPSSPLLIQGLSLPSNSPPTRTSSGNKLATVPAFFQTIGCNHRLYRQQHSTESVSSSRSSTPPPLLIVCVGTAQTAALWERILVPQRRPVVGSSSSSSIGRDVLIYQPKGLGLNFALEEEHFDDSCCNPNDDDDVSLSAQVAALRSLISIALPEDVNSMDIAGFSLGGRIAMAFACEHPAMVRKLHLTGVSLRRSDFGHVQLAAWRDLLQTGELRAFAWSAVLATYSPAFLRKNESQLPAWIEGVSQQHTAAGLAALLGQAHDEDGPWSVPGLVERLRLGSIKGKHEARRNGRILVGECDLVSPVEYSLELARALDWDPPTIVPNVGHCVPIETPQAWRDHLLEFLNQPEDDEEEGGSNDDYAT